MDLSEAFLQTRWPQLSSLPHAYGCGGESVAGLRSRGRSLRMARRWKQWSGCRSPWWLRGETDAAFGQALPFLHYRGPRPAQTSVPPGSPPVYPMYVENGEVSAQAYRRLRLWPTPPSFASRAGVSSSCAAATTPSASWRLFGAIAEASSAFAFGDASSLASLTFLSSQRRSCCLRHPHRVNHGIRRESLLHGRQ